MSILPEGEIHTIRLRCIEAASKAPMTHQEGYVVAVKDAAHAWYEWVVGDRPRPPEETITGEVSDVQTTVTDLL